MTMESYFQNRELGLQGTKGEYAVLVPLVERDGEPCLLFEVRAKDLKGHPGEVCFPGGRREAEETRQETALRETWEELGIPASDIEIIAPLDVAQDISDRVVWPFLAKISPEGLEHLQCNPAEVQEVFCVPLSFFLTYPEEVYRYPVQATVDETFPFARVGQKPGYPFRKGWMEIPIYEYQGRIIWGMTGRTVRWLVEKIRNIRFPPLNREIIG